METEQEESKGRHIARLVRAVPLGRWLSITRRFGMSQDEILDDFTAMVMVAANETLRAQQVERAELVRDQWETVEAMTLEDVFGLLKLGGADDEVDKSAGRALSAPGAVLPAAESVAR